MRSLCFVKKLYNIFVMKINVLQTNQSNHINCIGKCFILVCWGVEVKNNNGNVYFVYQHIQSIHST